MISSAIPWRENTDESPNVTKILLGNITKWWPQAEAYVQHMASKGPDAYDILMFSEHHLLHRELFELSVKLSQWGWHLWARPATPTGRTEKGTHGGVLILSRNHLEVTNIGASDTDEPHGGDDLHRA